MGIKLILGRKKRILGAILIVALIYLLLMLMSSVTGDVKKLPLVCNHGPEVQDKLRDLLIRTKESLDSLALTYFLCYHSLWGVLKMKTVLPWIDYLEICLINDELAPMDEAFIFRVFKREGLLINYVSSQGLYLVNDVTTTEPLIKLILFEKDSMTGQYRRVGWKNRLVPPNSCEAIHCFPPLLIEKPLPTANLLQVEMFVPREEVEIQKYLFPDNWWRDIEPEECKKESH